MKAKKILCVVFITALVIALVMIALEQYYVAVALVVGTVIMRHRELWSLIKERTLPPVDERARENTSRAIRNGFVFFAVVTAFLLLPFSVRLTEEPVTVHVLSVLFLSVGLVYMLSYLFYDRVEPRMMENYLRKFRLFLMIAGLLLGIGIISIFLHNAISGLFGFEEPVFFIIGVIVAPLGLVAGIVGSLVFFIMGLAGRPS